MTTPATEAAAAAKPTKPKVDLQEWMKSGEYLPPVMRDFHDAKDVFKTIHHMIDPACESMKGISWISGQCYVVDVFLWFMARRGWTLQRSRVNAEFKSLEADIEARRAQELESLASILGDRTAAPRPPLHAPRSLP